MESKVRKRTEALKAVPMTNVEHPVYKAAMPSVRTMSRMSTSGFLVVVGEPRSWSLVLANSKGYYPKFKLKNVNNFETRIARGERQD
jgi:hypothetical protein